MLFPNSVHTRPGQENSEKISKNIQKIKKPLFGNIPSQNGMRQAKRGRKNGMRQAEKEKKKFQSRILFKLDTVKKIPKKIAKEFEKLKNLFQAIFLDKTGIREAEKGRKKFQARISLALDPGMKIPKKIAKKFKKYKKTSFQHYSQPKRDDIGQERETKILFPNSVHTQPG